METKIYSYCLFLNRTTPKREFSSSNVSNNIENVGLFNATVVLNIVKTIKNRFLVPVDLDPSSPADEFVWSFG